ncbi:hypothetical protein C8J57DRAFT_1245925 [Mycena rebaudengoi]|nr:hypothetical protein C8J57DRAFT_1245925 [Mycena rebaudengoi]
MLQEPWGHLNQGIQVSANIILIYAESHFRLELLIPRQNLQEFSNSNGVAVHIATACDFWTGRGDFGVQFQVSISGTVILPWGPVCPACQASGPNGVCRFFAEYENHSPVFTRLARMT